MPRKQKLLSETAEPLTLSVLLTLCPVCGSEMRPAYYNHRRIYTLRSVRNIRLQIRRCLNQTCPRFKKPYRPEMETRLALPYGKFGLDVISYIVNFDKERSLNVPGIRNDLVELGIPISLRSVHNLLNRYHQSTERSPAKDPRLHEQLSTQGYVVLDLFWVETIRSRFSCLFVIRDFISGQVFSAKSIRSHKRHDEPADVIADVRDTLTVPIKGVVSDDEIILHKYCHLLSSDALDLDDYYDDAHRRLIPFTSAASDLPLQMSYRDFLRKIVAESTAARSWG